MRRLFISMGFVLAAVSIAACGGGDNVTKTDAPTSVQTAGASATSNGSVSSETATAVTKTAPPTTNSAGGGATSSGLAACSLITDARVAEVMSRDVNPAKASGDGSECTWEGATDVGLSVILDLRTGTHQAMQDYFDLPIGTTAPINGIGDAAHWTDSVDVLEVLDGNYEYTIQIIDLLGPTNASALDEAKSLAAEVSAKLP